MQYILYNNILHKILERFTYLELVLILPIKFHPDLSTLSVFQDFQFPGFLFPTSNPQCPWIRFELKMEHLRHKIFRYIKFQ